jgi:hypothetical protein
LSQHGRRGQTTLAYKPHLIYLPELSCPAASGHAEAIFVREQSSGMLRVGFSAS